MSQVGDRVLARWPHEAEWWYPGVVCGSESGNLEIQYDDGDRAVLTPDLVRPLQIGTGSRVYCRWQGGDSYFPGRVNNAVGAALYIGYDDGDQEVSSVSMVRVNSADL